MLALILGAAAVFGIAVAVRATTSSTVMVVRASELNYGEYLDWQNSVAGMITTDAEQDVYLSDTEVVEEVMVAEGQSVHKGDVLMRYDTTSTKLSLEKEKINYGSTGGGGKSAHAPGQIPGLWRGLWVYR